VVGGAAARSAKTTATADVCVLLPDTKTSVRYEQFDRPFIAAALKKAGVSHIITNALGDAQKQRSQADQCLANGAKVLIFDQLDAGSGAAIHSAARAAGAKVIDYDRLVVGGPKVSADYYISFDNVKVGKLIGAGVVAAMKQKGILGAGKKPVVAYLNGGPTDNNATLFKKGYASVIDPLFKGGKATKGPDQAVPDWDNQRARTIFEQMLVRTGNKIDAVAAANDGLANAVVTALKAKKLNPIPVGGQDATAGGVQNIISGWQSGTVYKPIKVEADAAAALAIALIKGSPVKTNGTVNDGKKNVPSILLTPTWVTSQNFTVLFKDGHLKRKDVCQGVYVKYCQKPVR